MKYSSVYPVIGIILAAVLMIAAIFDGLKKIVDVRSAGMLEKLKDGKLGVLAGMEGLYCVEIGLCTWNMAVKGSIFRWAANCWLGILMVCICICLLDIGGIL